MRANRVDVILYGLLLGVEDELRVDFEGGLD